MTFLEQTGLSSLNFLPKLCCGKLDVMWVLPCLGGNKPGWGIRNLDLTSAALGGCGLLFPDPKKGGAGRKDLYSPVNLCSRCFVIIINIACYFISLLLVITWGRKMLLLLGQECGKVCLWTGGSDLVFWYQILKYIFMPCVAPLDEQEEELQPKQGIFL